MFLVLFCVIASVPSLWFHLFHHLFVVFLYSLVFGSHLPGNLIYPSGFLFLVSFPWLYSVVLLCCLSNSTILSNTGLMLSSSLLFWPSSVTFPYFLFSSYPALSCLFVPSIHLFYFFIATFIFLAIFLYYFVFPIILYFLLVWLCELFCCTSSAMMGEP